MPLAYLNQSKPKKAAKKKPPTVKNSHGVEVYLANKWDVLNRFLLIGSENGTYYSTARDITKEAINNVQACLDEDPFLVLDTVKAFHEQGRALKFEPLAYVYALVCSYDDFDASKGMNWKKHLNRVNAAARALDNISTFCRTGTQLFTLVAYLDQLRGWGPALRRNVSAWYLDKPADKLAYQILKYRQRNGWSHKDVLRMAHPKPVRQKETAQILKYIAKGTYEGNQEIIETFEVIKNLSDPDEILALLKKQNVPWELLPTEALNSEKIWKYLLSNGMPLQAMIRNLNKMTALGVFDVAKYRNIVLNALADEEALAKARIHPIQAYTAARVYENGKGYKGKLIWTPNKEVTSALYAAAETTFATLPSTGQKILIGVDVSGSMGCPVSNQQALTCAEAAGLFAAVLKRSEPQSTVIAFDTTRHSVSDHIFNMDLRSSIRAIGKTGGGGTDCSLVPGYALKEKNDYDAIVVLSDNETWADNSGYLAAYRSNTYNLVKQYRSKRNSQLKYIGVDFATNVFNLVPDEPLSLAIAGMDSAFPKLVNQFLGLASEVSEVEDDE